MKAQILALILVVAVLGCTSVEPIYEIRIPGHSEIYAFGNDVRDVLTIPSDNATEIRNLLLNGSAMTIVFDGTSKEDNGAFAATVINMGKISIYFANEGKSFSTNAYYYIGDQWYDRQGNETAKPNITTPVVWLKGPSTGANETSVRLNNNTITVQGMSQKDIQRAGDRLSLIVLGITKVS